MTSTVTPDQTPAEEGAVSAATLFDEEVSRAVEAMYLTDDAVRRRALVLEALELQPGERVIDIGTGPGFLALEIADAVGSTGAVLAVDIAEPMLQIARKRCRERGWVTVRSGDASNLQADTDAFDVAVSVQVHEYVPDIEAGLQELHRILRPGGRAVIYSTDWASFTWHSDDDTRMQRVLTAFAAHCPHQTFARTLAPELRAAGFDIVDRRGVVQFNPVCDPNTFSYHLIGLISGFVTGRGHVSEEDAAEWAANLRQLADEDRFFFALNQYLYLVQKPA